MSARSTVEGPATFRGVMRCREFAAVFTGTALSRYGDYLAQAAASALVFRRTGSVVASAAAFAIGFLPWIGIGPMLAALAERHSHRRTMITCDLGRMVLMAAIALPGLPIPLVIGLLFGAAVLAPPYEAARSALLPNILEGDRYVVGLTAQKSMAQVALVLGYATGAGIAAWNCSAAFLVNAATFGFSAWTLRLWVRERAPTPAEGPRSLTRETTDGFRLVFGMPTLRVIAIVVFLNACFTILPEGLAAGWAADLAPTVADRGWYQGVIMAANPVGFVLGGVVIARYTAPARRAMLIGPLAIAGPLVLIPALTNPGLPAVAAMSLLCGCAAGGLVPPANSMFVQAVPPRFRTRAFGVVQSGLQILQGLSLLLAGAVATQLPVPATVGLWALVGVAATGVVVLTLPSEIRRVVPATQSR